MLSIEDNFSFCMNDIIVVGCSTGPDSMALVDLLLKIRCKYNLRLIIAHVNHNVRKESVEEEKYLFDYCKNNDLIFESMTINDYGDDNFHNEARKIRYRFFEKLIYKYKANYLMTAHHGDDLIETILMRIVRGSNINGYSGFKTILNMGKYKLVRPLIYYTKDEIREYDLNNNIKFYDDYSNEKDVYTRNRYRKYVLPFLKKEEKNVHMKFLKFSETLNGAYKYIENEKNKCLKKVLIDNKLIIDKFINLDDYIKREILYDMLSSFYQDDLFLITDKHIDLIFNAINSNKANLFVNLPNNVIAYKNYNYLELKKEVINKISYNFEFDSFLVLPNGKRIEKINFTNDNSNNICRLNSSEISLPLIVRNRIDGDKIIVKGLNGTKKIKDIFINEKIPYEIRNDWPIVLDSSGNVLWVPGLKKSKFDKRIAEDYDIILKYS